MSGRAPSKRRTQRRKTRSRRQPDRPAQETGRYTPPSWTARRPTPRWLVVLDVFLFIAGLALLLFDFVPVLPGAFNYGYMFGGFGVMAVAFLLLVNIR